MSYLVLTVKQVANATKLLEKANAAVLALNAILEGVAPKSARKPAKRGRKPGRKPAAAAEASPVKRKPGRPPKAAVAAPSETADL